MLEHDYNKIVYPHYKFVNSGPIICAIKLYAGYSEKTCTYSIYKLIRSIKYYFPLAVNAFPAQNVSLQWFFNFYQNNSFDNINEDIKYSLVYSFINIISCILMSLILACFFSERFICHVNINLFFLSTHLILFCWVSLFSDFFVPFRVS